MALVTTLAPARWTLARPPRTQREACRAFAWLMVAASVMAFSAPNRCAAEPRPAVTHEYDLKAAFLFNFAQFVEWPSDAFPGATTPITIGVLGEDPFGAGLDALVAGETIHKRPLLVRRFHSVAEIDTETCHILFISASEAGELDRIGKALAHRSILTVGDTKDFAAHTGIIGFELADHRLRLQINVDAANDARLTISSKLLRQAQIVRSSGGRK